MAKNNELFGYTPEKIHINSGGEILQHLALTPEDLAGKTVLDVGSGQKTLDKYLKDQGVEATVISYDVNESQLTPGDPEQLAIVGNYQEGLPFKDDSFDLIVNDAGPLQGNPISEKFFPEIQSVDKIYGTACRTLKPGGEIRVFNPFNDFKYGPGILLYFMAKQGKINVPKDYDFTQFYDNPEDMRPDDEGYPLPMFKSGLFWNELFFDYPPEEQKKLCQEMTAYTQERLKELGYVTEIEAVEIDQTPTDDEAEDQYNFCMVIKMKEKIPAQIKKDD